MNKRIFKGLTLAGILGITLFISSCKKDLNRDVPAIPVAGLMAVNLVPDNGAVGFAISGNVLTNYPLLFGNYSGGYQGIYVGTRDVTTYNFNSGLSLATASQLFKDSAYYSVFALGINGKYKNIIVEDKLDSLPSNTGQAFVRYVNAIADSSVQPLVNITAGGATIFNGNAAYGSVSDFKSVAPGNVAVSVNNEASINASRTLAFEQGKVYTILLSGIPAQTDTTKAVQIKFIQNGSVTATP